MNMPEKLAGFFNGIETQEDSRESVVVEAESKTETEAEIVEIPPQKELTFKNDEVYYNCSEVAKMFDVTLPTVYRWIYSGKLQNVTVGSRRKVPASKIKEFKKEYKSGNLVTARRSNGS